MNSAPQQFPLSMTSLVVSAASLRVLALHRPARNYLSRHSRLFLSPLFHFSMSVSIAMTSLANSEPAPAAAHSPNSDEEIEDEVDWDNPAPIQECLLVKLDSTLHEKMGVIKEFLTILILLLILIGFL